MVRLFVIYLSLLSISAQASQTEKDFKKYLSEMPIYEQFASKNVRSFDEEKELPNFTKSPRESKYYTKSDSSNITDEARQKINEDEAGSSAIHAYETRDSVKINGDSVKKAQVTEKASESIIGGVDIYCKGGDCIQISHEKNDEFQDVLTKISSVTEGGDEFSESKNIKHKNTREGDIRFFSGKSMTCKIRPFGYINCCSNKGWGKDLNVAKCPVEDKAIGEAKQRYLAHYLGEYCAKWAKWPGGRKCKERRRTYCVFSSKMARIINEEGRLRNNKAALGTAKHPNCRGITARQFEAIQITDIDFINPIYPWKGGRGTHDKKAGVAGDISLDDSKSTLDSEKLKDCLKNKNGDGVCAF